MIVSLSPYWHYGALIFDPVSFGMELLAKFVCWHFSQHVTLWCGKDWNEPPLGVWTRSGITWQPPLFFAGLSDDLVDNPFTIPRLPRGAIGLKKSRCTEPWRNSQFRHQKTTAKTQKTQFPLSIDFEQQLCTKLFFPWNITVVQKPFVTVVQNSCVTVVQNCTWMVSKF